MARHDTFDVEAPVVVIDRLLVRAGRQADVLALFDRDYVPLAAERQLRRIGGWVLPPLAEPVHPSEVLIQWEYPSVGALWIARGAEESDPRISGFWAELAPMIVGRSRRLGRPEPIALPPARAHQSRNGRARGFALVRPKSMPTDVIGRIEAIGCRGGVNDGGYTFRPGELTIDFAGALPTLDDFGVVEEVISLAAPFDLGFKDVAIAGGVKRTILLRLIPDADAASVSLMEQRVCDYARQLDEIVNWSFSRVERSTGAIAWTHCLEQEFADVADVTGAYLNHPLHWAVVDRFFHPEAPERVADAFFHSVYAIDRSVLADVSGAFADPEKR